MPSRDFKGKGIREELINYTVIDLETTGKYVTTCEIIEMSAIKIRNGEIVDSFSTLVKPKGILPKEIISLTGITPEMLKDSPLINDVIEDYIKFIGDDIILGHNISSFDSNIIYDVYYSCCNNYFKNDMLDTYHFARCCNIEVPDYKLVTLADYFNIEYNGAHRSLNDCMANYKCYELLKQHFDNNYRIDKTKNSSESKSHNMIHYSKTSQSLQELFGIIKGILCDNVLSNEEIFYLNDWMKSNTDLSGNYPFDIIFQSLDEILSDGIVTEDERKNLMAILIEQSDPVQHRSEDCDIDFTGKKVCLTGEFDAGSREEIKSRFEHVGAIIAKSVSSKTDYLIVGGMGSTAWSCGNYGSKVKKALELQNAGKSIKIIREDSAIKCLNTKNLQPQNANI